ncbi:MAG: imidazolonepropionase [Prevotellaceae bacterium]|jgi:imidazolonepropionase|nr:imidazolonepropionase [Prevotellaceae bacterium]
MLITNIKLLIQVEEQPCLRVCGADMSRLNNLENAWLLTNGKFIQDFGTMDRMPKGDFEMEIDASDCFVFPSFCDCHTHLVYAGSREQEFIDKINGLSYQEIARRGGGILHSAQLLHITSEEELFRQAMERVREIIAFGTGAVEIKSGYGLNLEDELKMLRVIQRIANESPLTVKSTFLGAHALPSEYNGDTKEYVNDIINEMIPVIATEELADYIDVFCETGFFSVEDTDRILNAGMKYGLRAKVHANQLSFSGGVQVGVKYNAISVDHLESSGIKEFESLNNSETMPVVLPGASFFLNMQHAPAKQMIDYGLPLAIASNYNPGSCPSGDMKFMMSLACINMKLNTQQAINAATINGAYAMDLSHSHGSISKGKVANLFITKPIPSLDSIPYSFNSQIIDTIILKGRII